MALAEITAILSGIKTITDFVKSVSSLSPDVAIKEKTSELLGIIVDLQNNILLMQSEYSKLLKSKDDFEKELIELKDWEKTKSQYKLKKIAPGTFAYSYEDSHDSEDPPHWLCANCYHNGKKSILQFSTKAFFYFCPKCKTEIHHPNGRSVGIDSFGSMNGEPGY